jgi:tRNA-splicing ligase RtcB
VQLGTLGRGNHFLEFQADEDDRLWLMIHSGSRAMGPAIRDWLLTFAAKSATGLRYLDSQSPAGQAYLADMAWARAYARCNRRAMLDATARLMHRLFQIAPLEGSVFDCDHNHVQRERHMAGEWWIHRKGAASAAAGQTGIIPGSMGTESYHVHGQGCAEALCSSSHGAGRSMSRTDAKRRVSDRDLSQQLRGIWYDPRIETALREEAPSAYKDIRRVMRAQRELTRITRRLRPILSYKSR